MFHSHLPVKDSLDKEEYVITLNLAEATIANLANAISAADATVPKQITLGGGSLTYVSLLIEADAPGENGGIRQTMAPRVLATGNVGEARKKGEKVVYPVTFKARKPLTGDAVVIKDVWDFTIATAAIVGVTGKEGIRLTGEGSATDSLTTITAGTLTSGDEIVLSIADEAAVITITHATAAINLTGSADFTMTDFRDWLHLSYDGSAWNETDRFDASA